MEGFYVRDASYFRGRKESEMSPLEIEILLHYFARTNDYWEDNPSSPASSDAIIRFLDCEFLKLTRIGSPKYAITRIGRALVETLTSVPLPEIVQGTLDKEKGLETCPKS